MILMDDVTGACGMAADPVRISVPERVIERKNIYQRFVFLI